jgi:predicted  nucleic acid-binding Zn-ribbon protein
MNIGFQLYQLQEIDTNLDSVKKRIVEIDALLVDDTKIATSQENFEKAKKQLISDTNEFNKINDEVQNKKIKISQSEASLYGGSVKNPKELEDLQLEIASLKKSILKLEDSLLEMLIQADQSEKVLDLRTEELKNVKSDFATQKSLLQGEKISLSEKNHVMISKKQSVLVQIEKRIQDRYEGLRKNKNGLAVTKLQDDACGACGAGLTASQRQEARSATMLFICPSCARIIYGSS